MNPTPLIALALAASPALAGSTATTSFSDLPGAVFYDFPNLGSTAPFGPYDFDFGAGHIVTATHNLSVWGCVPNAIGSHGEPLTIANDPTLDPGDRDGRAIKNGAGCATAITLDFSEPVPAVGMSFKHYSCGFNQQTGRTIVAYDGPGATGTIVGTVTTQGYAHPCFNIWIDFVGVISDTDDIRSMQILLDDQWTLMSGLAVSPGAGAQPCDGDADGDDTVDVNDISYVIFRLGNSGAAGTVEGDADGNGIVDVNDISYVIFRLGNTCT